MVTRIQENKGGGQGGFDRCRRGGGRGGFRDDRSRRGHEVSTPPVPPTATTAQEAHSGAAHRRRSAEEEAAAGMGAAWTARSGATDTEMRAREGLREMSDDSAPTVGANTLVARRPRGGMRSGQQTFLGWERGQVSSTTPRGAIVSSSLPDGARSTFPSPQNSRDHELVRKFVRESLLGVPENYKEPYFLNPRKDPFAGKWDQDWVVLRGFDNDVQTSQSSASSSQMEREVTETDVADISALCGNHSPVSDTSASPALEQTSHSSASASQIKREVAEAPQIGHEVAEGGSADDARRVDGGSLHNGGSVARTGAQLKSTGVADAVHKDETRVRTPGDGSLSSGGGSAVDARRVDDGSLHSGCSETKAGIRAYHD